MSTAPEVQGAMNQHLRSDPIPFIDVGTQRRRLGASLDAAVIEQAFSLDEVLSRTEIPFGRLGV